MPLEGEYLDELLTGYLDGQLSDHERSLVQQELAASAVVRQRLDDLRNLGTELKQLFRVSQDSGAQSKEFADRVVAAAQFRAEQSGLPQEHYLRADGRSKQAVQPHQPWQWLAPWKVAAAVAALAAIWLLAMYLPNGVVDDSANNIAVIAPPPTDDSSLSVKTVYVSDLDFNQQIIFLVDIELSPAALQRDEIGRILRAHGIAREQPIIADEKLEKAILDSRITVKTEESQDTAVIYFVRADVRDVGRVLDEMYHDLVAFPKLSFDMAIDNPISRLFQTIARSTGQRFAQNEVFAAPISVSASAVQGSPFDHIKKPAFFVSASDRKRGFSDGALGLPPSADSQVSSILLIVRLPEAQ